uniref:Uncharacterized protein n=1 Tax=Anguilla anguilla TaxID=7936 RepID=A0A0E9VW26_ANGAN
MQNITLIFIRKYCGVRFKFPLTRLVLMSHLHTSLLVSLKRCQKKYFLHIYIFKNNYFNNSLNCLFPLFDKQGTRR